MNQRHSAMTPVEAQPPAPTLPYNRPGALLAVQSYGITDRGMVRENNEDQFLIATLVKALHVQQTSLPIQEIQHSHDRSYLFVVADGMGGHAAGETASALAIESVEHFILETLKWFSELKGAGEDEVLSEFQLALKQANARLVADGSQHPDLYGMGTTLTLAYSLNDVLFVAHVGDSRCYLFRNAALLRLTTDHTVAEEMVRQGMLSPEDAVHHRMRHAVTNIIGADNPQVKVEVHKLQLHPGDTVLLCSDGLTEMLVDDQISRILAGEADVKQACTLLVEGAKKAGGRDNITVIVARYE
jgi:protein phosphatase